MSAHASSRRAATHGGSLTMRRGRLVRDALRRAPDDRLAAAFGLIAGYSFAVAAVTGIALLLRQVHHWSADVFVAAVCLRLLRTFFRGRFAGRARPDWLIWVTLGTLPVPGLLEQVKGFKNIAEALYLRDHVIGQLELADASDDPAERTARCTFVVVGAGYSGAEVAAQGQLFTRAALRRYPRIRPDEFRWLLVDRAQAVLPELGGRLGDSALRILRRRGIDVRLNTTIEEVTGSQIRLSDGSTVPTRTLVWCVGVTPGPLAQELGLDTVRGRIVVDEFLTVPGHLTRPRIPRAIQAPRPGLRGGPGRLAGGRQPAAHPAVRSPRPARDPCVPPLRPARQQAAGRYRLVHQQHRTSPARPARPDRRRIAGSRGGRRRRRLLPGRWTAPRRPAAGISYLTACSVFPMRRSPAPVPDDQDLYRTVAWSPPPDRVDADPARPARLLRGVRN